MPETLQSNFNGEWSPLMLGRVDLARYSTSVRTMENFTPTITGGTRKRPGLEYIDSVYNHGGKTRLETFTFSEEQTYLFEFSAGKLRIRRDGNLITDLGNQQSFIDTPYAEGELFSLKLTSTNDIIYIASATHWPRQLIRNGENDWVFQELELTNEPFEDENLDHQTIQPSGEAVGSSITLTASTDTFTSNMVSPSSEPGTKFKINHFAPRRVYKTTLNLAAANVNTANLTGASYVVGAEVKYGNFFYTCTQAWTANSTADPDPAEHPEYFEPGVTADIGSPDFTKIDFYIDGEWSFQTEGNWSGEWGIQTRPDSDSYWSTRYSMLSQNNANFVREGDESLNPVEMRLVIFQLISSSNEVATFTIREVEKSGEVEITSVTSATQATATVTKQLYSTTPTRHWAENEWSYRKGYPRQVFFKNNRLCFAATPKEGQAIWGSEVDMWANFKRGVIEDSQPFKDVLRTGNQDPIQWVSEQSETLLGLSSQIRNYTRDDGSSILAPGSNASVRQAGRGAANIAPVEVDDFTFYVQEGGRIIRGLSNDYERGVFAAPDMTREAEHVTKGGVVQMAFQLNRVSTLYVVTGEGELACLVFDPEIEKMGWYRLKTQNGVIESVAVLPSTDEEDEVYVVVKRNIDNSDVRYIERLKNDQIRVQEAGTQEEMFYVDSGVSFEFSQPEITITGLDHLIGETVQAIGDGDYLGEFMVASGGTIMIPASQKVFVGLPITAKLWPMPLEGMTRTGTTSGSKKRVKEITVDVINSQGLQTRKSPDDTDPPLNLTPRQASAPLDDSPKLYTGKLEVRTALPRTFDGNVFYESSIPFGVFIRNIITKWETTS